MVPFKVFTQYPASFFAKQGETRFWNYFVSNLHSCSKEFLKFSLMGHQNISRVGHSFFLITFFSIIRFDPKPITF
ncbi:hypothetical protein NITGR_250031 [Nitrospina gracilis 3/211]|uniref:Uncharacterized protein n=1 Tax=Nitrospina gracilis (strain 3/211) TaxID=1266370 RepID=M1YXW9_NITG3|nr:hypothetical protein NITGR_250031 [Nitrospina gracilis 3/211]